MKKMSAKTNLIFQIFYQLILLGVPLILSPYLTRSLGKESLGIYSFSYSIATYFTLFINLGIQSHGCRSIAACDNEDEEKNVFFSLQTIHTFFGLFIVLIYVMCSFLFWNQNLNIYLILVLYLFSSLIDTTWYYYGKENFKSVIFKNIFIKVTEVILIFTLVKQTEDLWIYTLIVSSSLFIGQLFLLPPIIHKYGFYKPTLQDMRPHIKPLIILAVSVIAVSVYALLDKTLIGVLIDDNKVSVALYDYAEKIVKLPVTLLGALGTVLLPKVSVLLGKGKRQDALVVLKKANILLSWLAVPSFLGLAAISKIFAPIYFGNEFAISGDYMFYLSPLALIIPFGATVRNSYMIPSGKDKQYLISLVSAAIINLILDLILIPYLKVYGAIIGTIAAELVACVLQFLFCRKELPVISYLLDLIPFILCGLIMYVLITLFNINQNSNIVTLVLDILIGIGSYVLCSGPYIFIKYKNYFKSILRKKNKKGLY